MSTNNPVQPANEHQRLKALKSYEILNSVSEEDFDRITELASIICGTPISLVTLLDENRQWFKSKVGLQISETPRDIAFCRYTIMHDQLLEVADASDDNRFKDNELVTGPLAIRFYAGFPLTDPSGYNLGTICVIDHMPRKLNEAQKRALAILATQVTALIVERRKKEELRHFESLFKVSPDLICIAGLDGYFKKVNPAFQQLTAISMAELLNTSFYELVHPQDLPAIERKIAHLSAGEQVLNFVARLRTDKTSYRHIQWTASAEIATGNLFAVGRDITQELSVQGQLAESELRLRAFFENSHGLMSTHDLNGKFLSVNTAGANMLGYTVDELLGMSLLDLLPENRHAKLKRYLQKVNMTGAWEGQVTVNDKSGSARTCMFSNVLVKSVDGSAYVIVNAIDITERYEMEVSLQHTKKMLEETNQVARIGGWEIDLITQKTSWTSVTKQIHGVLPEFEPDLQTGINFYKTGESRDLITKAVQQAMQYGMPWNLELQIVTEQGEDLWVRAIGEAEIRDGICLRLYGTFQDIDEKKKTLIEINNSRAILSAFVEHAPAAVAMLDTQMNYIAVSNRWLEDYGLSGKNVIGLSHYELFPQITMEGRQRHQRVLGGAVERNQEDSFLLPEQQIPQYVAWEMRPWYEPGAGIGGMMIFTQDVTTMVNQREQLKIAKHQAEEASVAKSEFLANMSHEIRTPLNGVIGFTDLLLKTYLNSTQQQYMTIVNQSANALLGIINDILDFSKIEAGKLELDVDKADLFEISAQATDIISYQIQKKGLEMLLNLSPDLPRFIWADSTRLKQILINLLTNAAKFTQRGEIELKIQELSRIADLSTIRFSVRDTGIGIKSEKQIKIFEAFSQEDGSTTKKYGGTGLGLTISNKLLAMMGSNLEVTSSLGQGSTFWFDIVVKSQHGPAINWHNLDRISKVLIVDDNDNNREIISQMLLLKNIKAVHASTGLQALKLLSSGERFDAILMDYNMPSMNGLETISEIREMFKTSKERLGVILLSSSADSEAVAKNSEELGVNHRLVKPVKMQEIYRALSQLYQQTEQKPAFDGDIDRPDVITKHFSILIAEDNAVNMLLTSTMVKRLVPNAKIFKAVNGAEAVTLFTQSPLDLILMDMQMPEMNGLEATRQIRQLEGEVKSVPIIALTAGNVKEEKDRCIESGMNDFIAKPIVEMLISDVLHKWLKLS